MRYGYVSILLLALLGVCGTAQASEWKYLGEFKATAYCSCKKCCGKSDGITASGVKVHKGTIAINWMPFGTRLNVDGKECVVEDRGAKSIFGSKNNHIKALDIWFPTHKEALNYGRKKVNVWQEI